jgi:glycosyltransferase involved in cell wall biosynthesis
MRVIQAMAGGEHGGAEAFFERLAPALSRAGLEQRILIRRHGPRAARLRSAGLDVKELAFGGAFDVVSGWRFRRAVSAFRPQVVITWMNRATRFCPPKSGFVHVGRLGGYYDLKYYRHCDHLAGNTRDICDWIVGQGWDPARVHYLPNFADAATAPAVDRGAFNTPPGMKLALALGRLHENKAFDVLLHAVAQVPDLALWIAGEGPLRQDLVDLTQRLGLGGRVRFLGWRDDVAALFAAADLFVCPSRHEPLGNVVIESWAHGIPVLAAASQGPLQLIEDGTDGLLVPVDDAAAMAGALTRLVADDGLRHSLGAAGRVAYEQRFTEQAVVGAYLEFLDKVAGSCCV